MRESSNLLTLWYRKLTDLGAKIQICSLLELQLTNLGAKIQNSYTFCECRITIIYEQIKLKIARKFKEKLNFRAKNIYICISIIG